MKYTLVLFILSVCLNANEFTYIQPVAVEEAPVVKAIEPEVKPEVEVVVVVEEAPAQVEEVQVEEVQALDTDNDGVVDSDDKCPNTAEGIKVNERGCELDSDADGIKDSKDQCPNTSTEFVVDGYGCPQTATLRVNFATNSYAISEQLIADLKEFAKFLQENVGYQVIIYGHTDSTGSDVVNKELSQNRANSVKEALTRYGIKEIRLTAIGKGSEDPVAENSTKEGRAANRRIEVELLQ